MEGDAGRYRPTRTAQRVSRPAPFVSEGAADQLAALLLG